MVIDQTPKLMRRTKMPIVKAKVGPRIMTLICDAAIFDQIPVKKGSKGNRKRHLHHRCDAESAGRWKRRRRKRKKDSGGKCWTKQEATHKRTETKRVQKILPVEIIHTAECFVGRRIILGCFSYRFFFCPYFLRLWADC